MEQAKQNLKRQQDLWGRQLTTRESLDKAENDFKSAESALQERDKQVMAQDNRIAQERASVESARCDLTKVRFQSPIDGIVTRRNIQEGETAMIGTMNNAGTVLLTLADMSVIQAEVEVDETNIPNVRIGAAGEDLDRCHSRSIVQGHVTEIGNSPIQSNTQQGAAAGTQATNFKVVVIFSTKRFRKLTTGLHLHSRHHDRRHGHHVTSVPIPAVAVRELVSRR